MKLKQWWYRRKIRRAQKRLDRKANFRNFKKACAEAEMLAKLNNTRYRVYLFDEYHAWCKEDIIRMKNRGVISKKAETGVISKNVLYDTAGHCNMHPQFSGRVVYNPDRWRNRIGI